MGKLACGYNTTKTSLTLRSFSLYTYNIFNDMFIIHSKCTAKQTYEHAYSFCYFNIIILYILILKLTKNCIARPCVSQYKYESSFSHTMNKKKSNA